MRAATTGAATATGTAWEALLDALEMRLTIWQAAVDGTSASPGQLEWPEIGRCPAHLEGRARRILATQRDLHARLTARRAAIGALLQRRHATHHFLPTALFVDERG